MNSCYSCTHKAICGVYDAFWDFKKIADEYAVLAPNYEDTMILQLTQSCSQFKSEGD